MKFFRIFCIALGCMALTIVATLIFGVQTTQADRYFRVVIDTNVTDVQDRLVAAEPDDFWHALAARVGAEDTQDFRREMCSIVYDLSYVDSGSIILIEHDRDNETKKAQPVGYQLPLDAVPSLKDQDFYIAGDSIFADVILHATSRETRLFGHRLAEAIAWEDATIAYEWNTYDPSFTPYSTQEPFEYFFRVDQNDLSERLSSRRPTKFCIEGAQAITFLVDDGDETPIPKTFELDFEFHKHLPTSFFAPSDDETLLCVMLPDEINGISAMAEPASMLKIRVDPDTAALPEVNAYRAQVELSDHPSEVEDHGFFFAYTYDILSFKAID